MPAESAAHHAEVLGDGGQLDAALVAGAAARSLAGALAGVEGDQLAAGEHGLHHDQGPGDGLLGQYAASREDAVVVVLVGKPP
jgi:hypothetical protein